MPVESRAFARQPKVAEGSGFRRLARLAKRPSVPSVTALANDERANAPAPVSKEWGQQAEWLLCDGLGGYACGTAIELPTRRYHSWLTVAAGDGRRRRLLAGVDERFVVGSGSEPMTPSHWRSFDEPSWTETRRSFAAEPVPTWILDLPSGARIERQLAMERGRPGVFVRWRNVGDVAAILVVRPLLAGEDSDALLRERPADAPQPVAGGHELRIDAASASVFLTLSGPATFRAEPCWYRDYRLSVDEARGYDGTADRYAPGFLEVGLKPGEEAFAAFTTGACDADPAASFARAVAARERRVAWAHRGASGLSSSLRLGVDDFFYRDRAGRLGVLAGFPWFSEWGRDAFVSLPGLSLAVGEPDRCAETLRSALPFLRDGLLPNIYGDGPATSHYGSADAALWFSLAVQRLCDSARDPDSVRREFGPALESIAESYERGAPLGLSVDDEGLLRAGRPDCNATWMDARTSQGPVTPRAGQPVEIVAMWCALLETLAEWNGGRWKRQAKKAGEAFVRRFWNHGLGSLHDCVDGEVRDESVRPNMVIAAALRRSPLSREQRAAVVAVADRELRTPVGLRTLSRSSPDYRGHYIGGQDQRDHAYHQGTVWPWLSGFYVEAALRAAEPARVADVARDLARWLEGFASQTRIAGLGHVSEVFDGDEPQRPGGTFAQAWNTGELLRALRMCDEAEKTGRLGGGA